MLFEPKEFKIRNWNVRLAPPVKEDAPVMVDYLKTVSAQSPFLQYEADEIALSVEEEEEFIIHQRSSADRCLINAWIDGQYAGNCSFSPAGSSRKMKHRAEVGIAILEEYTGKGLGQCLLAELLILAKEAGYEKAELEVYSENWPARFLYEKFGFQEWGRNKNAFRFDDGRQMDCIYMSREL